MHFHFFHLKCAFTALPIGLATSNPNSYSRITLPVPFYHSDNLICAPHINCTREDYLHHYVLMYWMVLTLQLVISSAPNSDLLN